MRPTPRLPLPARRALSTALCLFAAAQTFAAAPAFAADAPPAGVLQLEARASVEVVPDRTVALLAAVAQGSDLAALNADVASRIDAALRRAGAVQGVQASTGGITTQPRWVDTGGTARQDGWTVRAELRLRTADAAALARLLGQLGATLQVESVSSDLSAQLRERELEHLSALAIAAFRARAQSAARDFGYSSYTLGSVHLGDLQGAEPQPRPLLMAMRSGPGAPPPMAVQPGARELSVSVDGSVRLLH